ncbi:MAG: hypothetical protein QOH43_200 [Solirubrobacteraceae bacterium]|jgi:hypothetical protein|nr:hypothetical protein [Solirubrobacteraceae bacterium]
MLTNPLARLRAATTATAVHFHQGPQGRPAACHDARCPNPRLAIHEDGRS